jgi:beta-glucosidase
MLLTHGTRFASVLALAVAFSSVARNGDAAPTDPDARAAATEAAMTDTERFQLLHGIMAIPTAPPGVPITAGFVKGVSRLGVPDLVETDASLGVVNPLQLRRGDVATAMPSGLALAATFNPRLAFQGGIVMGAEARAKGFNVLLGGGVDLARDPRNGRNFEYLGEDPLLAGLMAGQAIAGTQSQGVISTAKHYALNDQETLRDSLDARIAEPALRESDLLAFQIAIETGQPGSVMCGYNKVNGDFACGSDFLLNRVLKADWRYPGWVMSDWGAVHAVNYFVWGLDQQSAAELDRQVWFGAPLQAEVAAGRVSRARVADAVRRILRSIYAVGADHPSPRTPIDYAVHAKVALAVAREGIVLLKNDHVLPLAEGPRSILVVGGRADAGVISGGGSSQVTPSNGAPIVIPYGGDGIMGSVFNRHMFMPSSPLAALRRALPAAKITTDSGYEVGAAAAAARRADVVIVFATHWQGENIDAGSLDLPEGQDALIAAVAAANPNTVVVLETGNPAGMPWLDKVKGVVEAWYPGQEGGAAIADVLSGAVNPSGRLPITFPSGLTHTPRPEIPGLGLPEGSDVVVDYAEGSDLGYRGMAAGGEAPLFAFGHGLSYTSFTQGGLKVSASGKAITATFTVANTGTRAGADTPQVYLVSAAGHDRLRLAAFDKIDLAPGASSTMLVSIDPRLLADWKDGGWDIAGGAYGFALGASAADLGPVTYATLKARHWGP